MSCIVCQFGTLQTSIIYSPNYYVKLWVPNIEIDKYSYRGFTRLTRLTSKVRHS